jgi:membrane-associated protease RseP (regulator of RpoE activity)
MAASIYFLFDILKMFFNPELVKLIKIPPITPLIPYLPEIFNVSWLPPFYFTYWIIAIALVAIFHEGFHGIFARFYNVKIKSSGFGFLGPFLAFFVEQDEKSMKKAKPFGQMTILAAGVFANVLLAILFLIILVLFFGFAYAPAGVIFNDYVYSVAPASILDTASITNESILINNVSLTKVIIEKNNYFIPTSRLTNKSYSEDLIKLYNDLPAIKVELKGAITKINNIPITSQAQIAEIISKHQAGDKIEIETLQKNGTEMITKVYSLELVKDSSNLSKLLIGIATLQSQQSTVFKRFISKAMGAVKDPNIYYKQKLDGDFTIFIYNLLFWLVMINFGVALANMWPVAIFDGGYFFYLLVLVITKKEKIAKLSLKIVTTLFLLSFVFLMLLWAKGMFI